MGPSAPLLLPPPMPVIPPLTPATVIMALPGLLFNDLIVPTPLLPLSWSAVAGPMRLFW